LRAAQGSDKVVLAANHSNALVEAVYSAARFLAGPFEGLFTLRSRKATTALDWGVAAAVWYLLARFIARLVVRRA
jgi:hypothetical protein